jgi:hypothetical protein
MSVISKEITGLERSGPIETIASGSPYAPYQPAVSS